MFSAEHKEVLGGGKTFADGRVSLVHEGLHVHQLQIRQQTLVIERGGRDQIRAIGKYHQANGVTRPALDEFGCAHFNGFNSRALPQRFLHALGKVQHDHDLQPAALNAVQDKRVDRAKQGDEQETNRRALQDGGHPQNGAWPADLFPRARELPAGPASPDAVLVTCAYLTDPSRPWVMQSLFLTAIGDSRERGARALEAFAYRYPEGETNFERFHVHKTIFPADFLADFGFLPVRAKGRVELARLELGGLQPAEEGTREKVLARVQEAFMPAPAPQRF